MEYRGPTLYAVLNLVELATIFPADVEQLSQIASAMKGKAFNPINIMQCLGDHTRSKPLNQKKGRLSPSYLSSVTLIYRRKNCIVKPKTDLLASIECAAFWRFGSKSDEALITRLPGLCFTKNLAQ